MSAPKQSGDGCLLRGCLFFVIAGLVLVGFAVASAYSTYRNLYALTSATPVPVPVADARDYAATQAKIDAFEQLTRSGQPATLRLNAAELNSMIAGDPGFAEARGRVYFAIPDNKFVVQVCLPLQGIRGMEGRWLNGSVTLEPKMENGSLVVLPKAIQAGTYSASIGTMWAMQQIAWSTRSLTDDSTAKLLSGVKAVKVESGELVIER